MPVQNRPSAGAVSPGDLFLGALLVLATLVVYLRVLQAGFIWDDDQHLTTNPCIVGPLGLREIWTTHRARICPLTLTTFWVEHAFWGLNPLPYHVVNVVVHSASAVLLWRLLKQLGIAGAWLGAALWALHPVQVETVAWITELKNVQSCLFYLLAIRYFVTCLEAGGARRRPWDYPLVLTFSALAMASKSSTVILPAVLGLCAWWMGTRRPGKIAGMLAPVLLMSVASAVLSVWTQQVEGADSPLWTRSLPERLAVAGRVFWFYLGKLAWPRPLVFIYPRWQIESGHWTAYWASAGMGLLLFFSWLTRKGRFRAAFFASAYFLLALLPVLGLVDHYFLRYSFVGDHFQYLASMGPLALASAGLCVGFRALGKPGRLLQAPFCAALLCVLGVLTWRQSANYGDAATLWRATIKDNPDCWLALHNLGVAAAKDGRVDEAFADFHRTLAINPSYAEAHNNLGTLLMAKGSLDAAFEEYRKALETDGNNPEINRSAGVALLRLGRPNDAIAFFQRALKSDPENAEVHNVLGVAYLKTGQLENAAGEFQRTVELSPAYAEGISNLGTALLSLGRLDEAVALYRRAVELAPANPAFHRSLGIALRRQGHTLESDEQFGEEMRLRR